MPRRNRINACCLSDKKQRELCLQCRLDDCDSSSLGCLVRKEVNKGLRKQYWRDPEKSRASRRKENMTYEQYESKKKHMKQYYQENKDVILMKQRLKKSNA